MKFSTRELANRGKLTGKAGAIASLDQTTSQVGDLAGKKVEADEFADVREVRMSEVRPDEEQARQLGITLEMLQAPDSVKDAEVRRKVDAIVGLAATITEIGQQTPAEVYREGGVYRLVTGERRYWAKQLLAHETITAKVLPGRPERLRLKQFVENVQREDFTPRETLRALEDVLAERKRLGAPITSVAELLKVTGLSATSASRWWAVLSGPDDVREALQKERIRTLASAEALARTKSAGERVNLLERLVAAESASRTTEVVRIEEERRAGGVKVKRGKGRPKKVILGSTSNLGLARYLLKKILGKEPPGIDWKDVRSVSEAFSAAIEHLESEMAQEKS